MRGWVHGGHKAMGMVRNNAQVGFSSAVVAHLPQVVCVVASQKATQFSPIHPVSFTQMFLLSLDFQNT